MGPQVFDTFTTTDNQADERALALLAGANVGPSLADTLRQMSNGGPPRRRLPTSSLRSMAQRDMTAASAANGGYVIGTANADPFDVLRPYSVVGQAGVTVLSGLRENLTIPRVTGAAAASGGASGDVSGATAAPVGDSNNRLRVPTDLAVPTVVLALAWHVLARPWEAAAAPRALVPAGGASPQYRVVHPGG